MIKRFPILYKYTKIGQPQQWEIIVQDGTFYTEEGMVGGVITKSLPTVCKPKSVGKKNETTAEQQALSEAQAKWDKKKDTGGYSETLENSGKQYFEPMLAHEYVMGKLDFKKQRVFVQPKLDGLRADNFNSRICSRNGKEYKSVPHLYQGEVRLDGELYNHEYKEDFNKIVSLCKKQSPTPEELAESAEKVQMWVYDMPDIPGNFSDRYQQLQATIRYFKDQGYNFVPVPTFEVFSEDEIKEWHTKFLSEGYEGTIVRLDGPYENKRSKNLLKFKDFVDEEFEIVGYEEGEGGRTGTIGKFIMKHDKVPGKTFKSNVKGNFDYLRDIWKNVNKYVGKTATVKYFQRTPDDVPRFPYIIKIAREEYE